MHHPHRRHHRSPVATSLATLLLIAAVACSATAAADWRASLEAGTEIRDGRATQRLRGTLSEATRPLTRALAIEYIGGDGTTVLLDGALRYWLTRGAYGFVDTRYLHDEPLGIDGQLRVLTGPGYRWQRTPAGALGIELGGGYVHTRLGGSGSTPTNASDRDDSVGEPIGLIRVDGFRSVLERLRLDTRLEATRTSRLTELRGEIGLAVNLAAGSVRYTLQTRRVSRDGEPARQRNLGFISFGYRF